MFKKLALILLALLLASCSGGPAPSAAVPTAASAQPAVDTPAPTIPPPTSPPSPTDTAEPTATAAPTATPSPSPTPSLSLFEKFGLYPWVDYTPTNYAPLEAQPTEEQVRLDLQALYDAGFRGLVTYSADAIHGQIPRLAREVGFEGVVMGIWAPGETAETQAALDALPYVDGYVVGNEGLTFDRYDFDTLQRAVEDLRQKTARPVTTTEVFNLYFKDERLFSLGDWIFPNAHPYWQSITDPAQAVRWTQNTFDAMAEKAGGLPVILKEVGLPTEGAPRLSEYQQAEYYVRLRESPVKFIYFEAFDQPWKVEDKVGGHWGLFNADRSPKAASQYVVKGYSPFYVYADADAPHNHFVPEGFMGCYRGLKVNENDTTAPYSGSSAISIRYTPCAPGWAGIYWWDPPGSKWCQKPGGFDLTGWTKLTFWAKGEKGGETVEFKVGGLATPDGEPCDSMALAQTTYPIPLTDAWQQYTIPLVGQPLEHIAGGFVWVTDSTEPITIYLDEIRFEWSER